MWRNVIDKNALELWETRCKTMGLLPTEGIDSVVGRAACRALRNNKKKKGKRSKMTRLYRRYYFTWSTFICRCCHLSDLRTLCCCSTRPCDFEFVDLNFCAAFLEKYLDFQEIWSQRCLDGILVFVDVRNPTARVSFPPHAGRLDPKYLNPFDSREASFIFASRDHFERFCVDFIEDHFDDEKHSMRRKVLNALYLHEE